MFWRFSPPLRPLFTTTTSFSRSLLGDSVLRCTAASFFTRIIQTPLSVSLSSSLSSLYSLQTVRLLNRNARRPKKANHGKRPCSHARRWAKRGMMKSVAYREKIFGFW